MVLLIIIFVLISVSMFVFITVYIKHIGDKIKLMKFQDIENKRKLDVIDEIIQNRAIPIKAEKVVRGVIEEVKAPLATKVKKNIDAMRNETKVREELDKTTRTSFFDLYHQLALEEAERETNTKHIKQLVESSESDAANRVLSLQSLINSTRSQLSHNEDILSMDLSSDYVSFSNYIKDDIRAKHRHSLETISTSKNQIDKQLQEMNEIMKNNFERNTKDINDLRSLTNESVSALSGAITSSNDLQVKEHRRWGRYLENLDDYYGKTLNWQRVTNQNNALIDDLIFENEKMYNQMHEFISADIKQLQDKDVHFDTALQDMQTSLNQKITNVQSSLKLSDEAINSTIGKLHGIYESKLAATSSNLVTDSLRIGSMFFSTSNDGSTFKIKTENLSINNHMNQNIQTINSLGLITSLSNESQFVQSDNVTAKMIDTSCVKTDKSGSICFNKDGVVFDVNNAKVYNDIHLKNHTLRSEPDGLRVQHVPYAANAANAARFIIDTLHTSNIKGNFNVNDTLFTDNLTTSNLTMNNNTFDTNLLNSHKMSICNILNIGGSVFEHTKDNDLRLTLNSCVNSALDINGSVQLTGTGDIKARSFNVDNDFRADTARINTLTSMRAQIGANHAMLPLSIGSKNAIFKRNKQQVAMDGKTIEITPSTPNDASAFHVTAKNMPIMNITNRGDVNIENGTFYINGELLTADLFEALTLLDDGQDCIQVIKGG